MFESLAENLGNIFRKLAGQGKLTEDNVRDGMREVRTALLEADVSYKVAKDFVAQATERAVGQEVIKNVRPDQQIVKIVYDELVKLMGAADVSIKKNPTGPTVIMMAGLQGSGKTTTCGKLAIYLRKKGEKPLLVAADMQRPAAVEQLKIIGKELDVPVYFEESGRPPRICQRSIAHAVEKGYTTVIFDTAGRLHVDEPLMAELKEVVEKTKPQEIFLVTDAMSGQDAVNSSKEFNDRLEISGVILTKLDGDARGGAALSIRAVTGKPIKFVGVGEKADKLEEFHPERMADRILGMGDVRSLVEKAQENISQEEAQKMQDKLLREQFDFSDFLKSMQQIRKMGSLKDVMGMIPGMGQAMKAAPEGFDEGALTKIEALIFSMTPEERSNPEIINQPRMKRIARGSGSTLQDVTDLMKQFREMQKVMKHFKKSGFFGKMFGARKAMKEMQAELSATGAFKGQGAPNQPGQMSAEKRRKAREERKRRRKHMK